MRHRHGSVVSCFFRLFLGGEAGRCFFSFFSFLLPRNDGVGTLVQNTDDKENKQTQTKRYRSRLCTQHTRTHTPGWTALWNCVSHLTEMPWNPWLVSCICSKASRPSTPSDRSELFARALSVKKDKKKPNQPKESTSVWSRSKIGFSWGRPEKNDVGGHNLSLREPPTKKGTRTGLDLVGFVRLVALGETVVGDVPDFGWRIRLADEGQLLDGRFGLKDSQGFARSLTVLDVRRFQTLGEGVQQLRSIHEKKTRS